MNDPMPTIFVIDDDASVRTSLTRLLRAAGFDVQSFHSAEDYLEHSSPQGVGCLVLDVCMEGISGTDLQARLSDNGCDMPIVFLTGHGSIPMSVSAMKHGAANFLTKPVDEQILLESIQQALASHTILVRERKEVETGRERLKTLTPREFDVLRGVLTGALNKQIAARLGIVEKTVKIHRSRVMEKLGVTSVAELVRFCAAAEIPPMDWADM